MLPSLTQIRQVNWWVGWEEEEDGWRKGKSLLFSPPQEVPRRHPGHWHQVEKHKKGKGNKKFPLHLPDRTFSQIKKYVHSHVKCSTVLYLHKVKK